MWDEERVEAAIDEAARRMTAGEPGADLRVRVMARIEEGSGLGVRVSAFGSWRPALAGLSLAAILLAIVVWREPDKAIDGPARQSSPGASSAAARPSVPVPPAPLGGTYEQKVRLPHSPPGGYGGPRKPDTTYEMTTYEMTRRSPSDLDAVPLPSIDLESIAIAALPAAASIHVEPLQAAAPIAVAPLRPENEGDPR